MGEDLLVLAVSGLLSPLVVSSMTRCVESCLTFFYLVCITVTIFAVVNQPAVAQRANTTLPLTYCGQVLQSVGNQTCPSEEQCAIVRTEIEAGARSLLRVSILCSGKLLRENFCELVKNTIIAEKTFADCLFLLHQRMAHPQI